MTDRDREMMREALLEAFQAESRGEVPAGAVLVSTEGEIIGRAGNGCIGLNDPTAHAEIRAIRQAAAVIGNYRLTGGILYSTLEPCPMCLMAAFHSRLARVVYGAAEPKWGAAGSLINLADAPGLNHKLEISGGVLAEECQKAVKDFFKRKRKGI